MLLAILIICSKELFKTDAAVWAEKPHKDIYNFTGKLSCVSGTSSNWITKIKFCVYL